MSLSKQTSSALARSYYLIGAPLEKFPEHRIPTKKQVLQRFFISNTLNW